MTPEQLTAIPRRTAQQVITDVAFGVGYHVRLLLAVEAAMNEEWWRGYHAGVVAEKKETLERRKHGEVIAIAERREEARRWRETSR